MNDEDIYPLDEDAIELVADIQRRGAMLQGELTGVLNAFLKREKLTGRWELAQNSREIHRTGAPVPAPKQGE
jgi:hypothetical protein